MVARRRSLDAATSSQRFGDMAVAKPEQDEIKVFISHRDSTCGECLEELGSKAWITLVRDKGALCLSCADLDQLIFLASGDAALTRRARQAFSFVRRGLEVEPGPQAIRAARASGRRAGAGISRRRVSG